MQALAVIRGAGQLASPAPASAPVASASMLSPASP